MSDFDRGKYYGKKKYPAQRETGNTFGSRFFNSKITYSKGDKESDRADNKAKNIKQPTILLKARDRTEDRSVSPKQNVKDSETTAVAMSTTANESSAAPSAREMTKSVKFLEDGTIFCENLQDYVQENNDFLVVGIVGAQGVGKSTILNLIAENKVTCKLKKLIFGESETDLDRSGDNIKILSENISDLKLHGKDRLIFKLETKAEVETSSNTTYGIDCFITPNRTILLDSQPMLSASILDELIQSENKRSSIVNEHLPLENSSEIQGLQLLTFLMSVCHLLIVVQDYFFDNNFIRFIQSAEMLKPTISNPEDEIVDHFPHLLLVHNRAQMEDFTPAKFKIMQEMYRCIFNKTKMHLESGMSLASGRIISSLCPDTCGDPINLFLVPEYNEKNIYKGHLPLEDLIKRLKSNILGASKYPLTHVQLSEKNWLVYCAKVWDHVKKSSFFVEYTKLMP